MQIQERIVSLKKHTIGFVVDHKELTRAEAVKAVKRGQIKNARIVNSNAYGAYLVGEGKVTLYDLPTRFARSRRFANKRGK